MPIVALNVPVILPIGPLRGDLARAFPEWQWRCGDDDMGKPQDRATLDRPQTIMGRGTDGMIMVTVEERRQPLPLEAGAPPHRLYLQVSHPSTDNAELAKRIAVVVCASMMIVQDEGAHCQIAPGGRWYSTDDMRVGIAMCTADGKEDRRIDDFLLRYGNAGASAAPSEPSPLAPTMRSPAEQLAIGADVGLSFARMVNQVMGEDLARELGYAKPPEWTEERPQPNRLPTFVVLLGGPLSFAWAKAHDYIRQLDPKGDWTLSQEASGIALSGRGATVTIATHDGGVPAYAIDDALSRSFWFKEGRAHLAGCTTHLVLTCDLDTRAAAYEDVRETATVITLLLGLLAGEPPALGVINAAIGTVHSASQLTGVVGCLARGELPVMLWTWTAFHSMADDAVSLSTGGMLPFLGYEVEVWNAPASAQFVADKLSKVLIYLLHEGPIVTDGNSFGEAPGDTSIRGFFGDSRAGRDKPIKALLLEFDSGRATRPQPDPLPQPIAPPAAFPRRSAGGGFGRKGL